jgi:hypothetical protein
LLLIGILFVFVLRQNIVLDHHAPFEKIPLIFPFFLTLQAFPVSLLPGFWAPSALAGISAIGAGRTYLPGRGAVHTLYGATGGSVWRNWGIGMAQLVPILVLLNVVLGVLLHKIFVAVGGPLHGSVVIGGRLVTLAFIVWLNFGAAFLLAGLVYSLTYFSTVLLKHAKGIIYGAGVLVGYLFLEQVVPHYWRGIQLPRLMLQGFIQSSRDVIGISDHLGISVATRVAIILLFPLATQFVLQKTDIDR